MIHRLFYNFRNHLLFLFRFYLFPLLYSPNSVRMSVSSINSSALTAFTGLYGNANFENEVSSIELPVRWLLECVETEAVSAAKETIKRI